MSPALWSVLIQAAGSAATLVAALWVASRLGLAAQGQFGLLRSWSDVLVMVAIFGLPQGLLHLQYRDGIPVSALRHWTLRYLAGSTAAVLVVLALIATVPALALMPHREQMMVLLAAVPLAAAHQLWRALTLRGAGPVAYAGVTAAPALLILVALVPYLVFEWHSGFEWALFAAAGMSALVSGWLAKRVAKGGEARVNWSRRTLWSVSAQTGAQSIMSSLNPAAQLSLIGLLGASLAQIGTVSLGLQLYQVFGIAAVYAAPLVYDHAARRREAPGIAEMLGLLRARVPRVWRYVFVAGVGAGLAGPWLLPLAWPGISAFAPMLSIMTMAGLLALGVRLLSTLQQARGKYLVLSLQALTRLIAGTAMTALALEFWPATLAVPSVMLMVEASLLAWLVMLMRRVATVPQGALNDRAAP
ncbi:MAG: hypothetical protein KDG44_07055 [Burkholderiaceae bacterium]|nr:hypothetical protein [Burkholderiaceae bacterium]